MEAARGEEVKEAEGTAVAVTAEEALAEVWVEVGVARVIEAAWRTSEGLTLPLPQKATPRAPAAARATTGRR